MTNQSSLSPAAVEYLKEVDDALRLIPSPERQEMLGDLREHLSDITSADPAVDLHARLGTPHAYARTLLESSGVREDKWQRVGLVTRARHLLRNRRVRATGTYTWNVLRTLQPAWWALRGYLAVVLLSAVTTALFLPGRTIANFPFPYVLGSKLLGAVLVVLFVVASVAVGRRQYKRPFRIVAIGVNLLIAWAAFGFGQHVSDPPVYGGDAIVSGSMVPQGECLRADMGYAISNLYVYDDKGNLVPRAFVYDQFGNPVTNICQSENGLEQLPASYRDENGRLIKNMYPLASTTADAGSSDARTYQRNDSEPSRAAPQLVVPAKHPARL